MKITAQIIVKNEDLWLFYAVKAVEKFVDKILIFDTGSSDSTVKIINSLKSEKIEFEQHTLKSSEDLVDLRALMLTKTKTEWFLIVDGDEIWPELELKKLLSRAEKAPKRIKALFNRSRNCIGDVYHYLPDSAGKYQIAGISGNLNVRLMRKSSSLRIEGKYPLERYVDGEGPVLEQTENLEFIECWYLHTAFLRRSSGEEVKVSGSLGRARYPERGHTIKATELPEVLKLQHPLGFDPTRKRGWIYEIMATVLTPVINIKRLL